MNTTNNTPSPATKRILLIAGETSGDLLGGALIDALKAQGLQLTAEGIGGDRMRKAGMHLLRHCKDIAVVGAWEVLKQLRQIRDALRLVRQQLAKTPYDMVILIDYPGFNLKVAKLAKAAGIPVFFYVSPQIWAWRAHRIKTIRANVDMMAVLFRFELLIYQKAGVPVTFVGHPMVDQPKHRFCRATQCASMGLDATQPIVGLLPGSRKQEIQRLLPTMIDSAQRLQTQHPKMQWILPVASGVDRELIRQTIGNALHVTLCDHNHPAIMQLMDAAIAVSGTVTLELALMGVPQVVIYKLSRCTFALAKRLIKTPYIALCNLVAQAPIAQELIQDDANPANIAQAVNDAMRRKPNDAASIQEQLLSQMQAPSGHCAAAAAQAVLDLLQSTSSDRIS